MHWLGFMKIDRNRVILGILVALAIVLVGLGIYYGLDHREGTPGAKEFYEEINSNVNRILTTEVAPSTTANPSAYVTNLSIINKEEKPNYEVEGFGQRQTQPEYEWMETTKFSRPPEPGSEWFDRTQ